MFGTNATRLSFFVEIDRMRSIIQNLPKPYIHDRDWSDRSRLDLCVDRTGSVNNLIDETALSIVNF